MRHWLKAGALLALLGIPGLQAAPYRPTDDTQVLERLPAGLPARAAPAQDPTRAAAIAQAHIERSRREADPRFLGYAEGVLRPWWDAPTPPASVLLMRATIRQARHEFDAALADLALVLKLKPGDPQAALTRATILRVQGRYAESARECQPLRALVDDFYAVMCESAARGLMGQARAAAAALDALRLERRDPATRAWWTAERAELERRLGDSAGALRLYRAALAAQASDPLLLASAAQLLLDLGQPGEALEMIGSTPQPELLRLRRVQALRALGQPDLALEAVLAESYAAARHRGEDLHLREEARFALEARGDAATALRLAQDNWRSQREPEDARVLLDAARAAGDRAALEDLRRWRSETGMEDAALAARLGEAAP